MSADLQWLLTKNWSTFQVKRRQSGTKTLTSEPLNLTNVHSQKYSGLVSDKAVGLAVAKDNKGAVLSVKSVSILFSIWSFLEWIRVISISNFIVEQASQIQPIQICI